MKIKDTTIKIKCESEERFRYIFGMERSHSIVSEGWGMALSRQNWYLYSVNHSNIWHGAWGSF